MGKRKHSPGPFWVESDVNIMAGNRLIAVAVAGDRAAHDAALLGASLDMLGLLIEAQRGISAGWLARCGDVVMRAQKLDPKGETVELTGTAEDALRERGVEWDEVRVTVDRKYDVVSGAHQEVPNAVHRYFMRGAEEVAYETPALRVLSIHPSPRLWGDHLMRRSVVEAS